MMFEINDFDVRGFLSKIKEKSIVTMLSRDEIITEDKGYYYFIKEGGGDVYFSKGNLCVSNTFIGMPIGFHNESFLGMFYLKTKKHTELYKISITDLHFVVFSDVHFTSIFNKLNEMFYCMIMKSFNKIIYLNGMGQVLYYLKKCSFEGVNDESLISYIFNRTLLSKGYIHKIIQNLKQNDYISIKNGRLVSINKDLHDLLPH